MSHTTALSWNLSVLYLDVLVTGWVVLSSSVRSMFPAGIKLLARPFALRIRSSLIGPDLENLPSLLVVSGMSFVGSGNAP